MKKIELTEQMKHCAEFFKDLGNVYFVGGCIRSILMNETPHDYDMITDKEPEEIISYIKSKGKRAYLTGKRYGTISCKIGPDNEMTEITTFRKELYDFNSRKPTVTYTKHLDEDLNRRDFTINSIVCKLDGTIKDLKGGMDDMEKGILRCVGNSKQRFKEDPLRILRAIRFAAKYDLTIEENTAKRIESCRWEMLRLSKERIIDEMNKILLLTKPENVSRAIALFWKYNLFQIIIPEMQLQENFYQQNPNHDFTLDVHTLNVIYAIKREPILRNDKNCIWAALLHDIAKPFTQTLHKSGDRCNYINHEILGAEMANDFCIKYKFSNDDRNFIVDSVRNHIQEDCWLKKFDDGGKKLK